MVERPEAFRQWQKGVIDDAHLRQVVNDLSIVCEVMREMGDRGAAFQGYFQQWLAASDMENRRKRVI